MSEEVPQQARAMRMEIDSGDTRARILIGNGGSFPARSRTAIKDTGAGADERRDELRGFILNHAKAGAESGGSGDVPLQNQASRSKKCAGSEFDAFGAKLLFRFGTTKAKCGHGNRLVVLANAASGGETVDCGPTLDEPQWMRTRGSESLGRRVFVRELRRRGGLGKASGQFTQDGIYEGRGGTFARALDEFHALVDRSAGRHAGEPAQLVDRDAKCGKNFRIEPG